MREHWAIVRSTLSPMSFIPKKFQNAASGGNDKPYLSPNKVESAGQVRFALLTDQPLCYFEVWASDGDRRKPFRFADDPTPSEIEAELGPNYTRQENDKGQLDPVKFTMAVPIYNYDRGRVETFTFNQKGIQKEFDEISQMEEYSDLLAWDFVLTRAEKNSPDMYGLRAVPRKPENKKVVADAWSAAVDNGYDISRMLTGGQPHVRE